MTAAQRKNPFTGISAAWTYVSVKHATELVGAIEHNRKVSPALIARYARDMLSGSWGLSESAIVIDESGNVINGQHRLGAVMLSRRGCWFVVVHGVPRGTIIDMDQGKKRTLPEALTLSGEFDGSIDNNIAAWSKFIMVYGTGQNGVSVVPTHHEVARFIMDNYTPLTRVRKLMTNTGRGVTTAPVFAVIVQAWIKGESKTRISQFVHTMLTGESQGKQDSAAVRLRNWLLTSEMNYGGTGRVEVYEKTRRALRAFLESRPLSKLFPLKEDPWEVRNKEAVAV